MAARGEGRELTGTSVQQGQVCRAEWTEDTRLPGETVLLSLYGVGFPQLGVLVE